MFPVDVSFKQSNDTLFFVKNLVIYPWKKCYSSQTALRGTAPWDWPRILLHLNTGEMVLNSKFQFVNYFYGFDWVKYNVWRKNGIGRMRYAVPKSCIIHKKKKPDREFWAVRPCAAAAIGSPCKSCCGVPRPRTFWDLIMVLLLQKLWMIEVAFYAQNS